ncbi:glycerophosphodiester phosphodiesterase GDPDL7 isoform X2 [Setaria italica]|nr:glycerophosphodiester phosphodiesterase GDPDL7 isoform X2 [Setaria italica]XP_022681688.1 glycerophosphodiester phosphodiesterase GDPDL7 isoform X2 [Setaria italica]XP_022681689.1 glycerophosphodiester phosphodiesterase GDPDL7 isoform X2 [Setaria italica]
MGVRYPCMFLVLLLLHGANAALKDPVQKWQTLSGAPPLVIARGGYSGLFPDSSHIGYQFALENSLPEAVLYCDLLLSSDNVGFCHSCLALDNSTLIAEVFPKNGKTYKVNGEDRHGWFSIDFTSNQLMHNVTLIQNVLSRPSIFDGTMGMSLVDDVVGLHPPQLWINVQYGQFFQDHKLNIGEYILSKVKEFGFNYVSSPEVGFLKTLGGKLGKSNVKLVLQFLDEQVTEPSTKQTYGAILKDLKSIKTFASGILVPKTYIWPVNKDHYLQPATNLVKDAHALGLEVYAFKFANDDISSYNYSYDPSAEYLQFIDNSDFSVDGVLTDFPSTASAAVACLAHTKHNPLPPPGNDTRPLIITHNGASGIFPGGTDLAYQQAVEDGADIIDCSVQMSKDAVLFCLDSPDLTKGTTAATMFTTKVATVNEIQNGSGIFSFDLSWSEIQTLKPDLVGPFSQAGLKRNPAAKNSGKLMTLAEFLAFSKSSNVSGILVDIRNAPYLATRGIGIVDAISSALVNASYDKETRQQVLIASDDTAVLGSFNNFPAFKRVLQIGNVISDVSRASVEEVAKFADAVSITRGSVVQAQGSFLVRFTDVIDKMHAANLSVYVGLLKDEFMNLGFDFWANPMVEIVTYSSLMADGIVTEFPATAAEYFRSPCSDFSKNLTYTIMPAKPGTLINLTDHSALPPAQGPAPVLEPADVVDPPLPAVTVGGHGAASSSSNDSSTTSSAMASGASSGLCLLVAGLAVLLAVCSR